MFQSVNAPIAACGAAAMAFGLALGRGRNMSQHWVSEDLV